jgi:hypothetical protein
MDRGAEVPEVARVMIGEVDEGQFMKFVELLYLLKTSVCGTI